MRESARMNDDRIRIWDTDHVSLWQRSPEILQARRGAFPPERQAVTIITVEEQWRGRLAQIARNSGLLPGVAYSIINGGPGLKK